MRRRGPGDGGFATVLIAAGRAGAFPNLSHPRTVWMGADEGADEIDALHKAIDESLAKIGFRAEPRRFRRI